MIELPELPLPKRPYRGIDFFRFVDQPIFFAREQETTRLVRLVTIYRGALCYGDSGAGKSSLINAGFIPAILQEGFLPERIRVRPDPGHEFEVERISFAEDGEPPFLPSRFSHAETKAKSVVMSAREFLESLPFESTKDAMAGFAAPGEKSAEPDDRYPLLIFDQFEEFVTLFEEAPEGGESMVKAMKAQKAILEVLLALLQIPNRPGDKPTYLVKLLFVFRDDYLAKLAKLFLHVPNLRDQYIHVTPPRTHVLRQIIRGPFETKKLPAGHFDHEIAPELAEDLATAIEEKSGAGLINLTEVQIACSTLWDDPNREKTFAAAETKGDALQKLLENHLTRALDKLGGDRETAVTILAHLVTSKGTRNIVAEEDLLNRVIGEDRGDRQKAQRTLESIVANTKLIRRQLRYETPFYDISSEFLVPWIRDKRAAREFRKAAQERVAKVVGISFVCLVIAVAIACVVSLRSAQIARQQQKIAQEQQANAEKQKQLADKARTEAELAARRSQRAAEESQKAAVEAAQASAAANALAAKEKEARTTADESNKTALATNQALKDALDKVNHALEKSSKATVDAIARLEKAAPSGKVPAARDLQAQLTGIRNDLSTVNQDTLDLLHNDTNPLLQTARESTEKIFQTALSNKKLVAVLKAHTAEVRMVEFSPSGEKLASASKDKTVCVWDRLGNKIETVDSPSTDGVRCVDFDPTGQRLVIGTDGGALAIHQLGKHDPVTEYREHHDSITSAWFDPQGKTVISSSAGTPNLELWDAVSGKTVRTLAGHDKTVTYARFDSAGKQVISSGDDETARIWDLEHQEKPATVLKLTGPAHRADFNSSGTVAITAAFKTTGLWDAQTGNSKKSFDSVAPVLQSLLSPDGKSCAVAGSNGGVVVWTDLDTAQSKEVALVGHIKAVHCLAWSPDSSRLVTGSDDNTARLWDVKTRRCLLVFDQHTGPINWVAYSPKGDLVATASTDSTVCLWNPNAEPEQARPSNIAWAYYGIQQSDHSWTERNFKNESRDDKETPHAGDWVVALNLVPVRKDVIRLLNDAWKNAEEIGAVHKGDRLQIGEVRGPDDTDPEAWIWINFTWPQLKADTVRGKIISGGVPLARTKIEFTVKNGPNISTTTDADGGFTLKNVPYGDWYAKVTQPNGIWQYFQRTVNARDTDVGTLDFPANDPPAPNLHWSAYGVLEKNGTWDRRYFNAADGGTAAPKVNDYAVAIGDTFARKTYLQFDYNTYSWLPLADQMGVTNKGQKVQIKQIANVITPTDTTGVRQIWIGY